MGKMKRFIDCYIPITTCNLRCNYCYITQQRLFDNRLPKFKYNANYIGEALSKERLGGVSLINLCGGGETLLPKEIVDIIYNILKQGHYVMVVTNGTVTQRFDEVINLPKELLERLMFKFSFHYLELERLNILEEFFNNIHKVKNAGCSFTVELTPNDEIIPYIDKIKNICKEKVGAICHVTVGRADNKAGKPILTEYTNSQYKNIWEIFDSQLFDFKLETFNVKRKEYCYAGDWTTYLDLGTGELRQCYSSLHNQNIFNDINKPIEFIPIGKNCKEPHCYNSHAFMALGAIPSVCTPKYADMRNRKCKDGSEWLTPKVKEFLSDKLYENNDYIKHYDETGTFNGLDYNEREINVSKDIRLKTVEVLDKENNKFYSGEKMKLKIYYYPYKNIELGHIRITIYKYDDSAVKVYMTSNPIKISLGETNNAIFQLDTKEFLKGDYYIGITLFTIDTLRGYEKQDDVKKAFEFCIN